VLEVLCLLGLLGGSGSGFGSGDGDWSGMGSSCFGVCARVFGLGVTVLMIIAGCLGLFSAGGIASRGC